MLMKLTHFEGGHHHSEAYDTGWHLTVGMKDKELFSNNCTSSAIDCKSWLRPMFSSSVNFIIDIL